MDSFPILFLLLLEGTLMRNGNKSNMEGNIFMQTWAHLWGKKADIHVNVTPS